MTHAEPLFFRVQVPSRKYPPGVSCFFVDRDRLGALAAGIEAEPIFDAYRASRPGWFDDAACRGAGPGPWFSMNVGRARRICWECPVRLECLSYALADPELLGLWGGLTAPERARVRRRRAAA